MRPLCLWHGGRNVIGTFKGTYGALVDFHSNGIYPYYCLYKLIYDTLKCFDCTSYILFYP